MADPLLAAYRHTSNNWAEIQASTVCGCCSCVQIFPADDIVAWTGLDVNRIDDPEAVNQQTALCPKCGSESVLGDKAGFTLTAGFLGRMSEAWFQQTIIRRTRPPG